VKGLSDFIEIPNLSPMFDAEFLSNGEIQKAMVLVENYINKLEIVGMTKHEFTPEGKSPMICYVVDPQGGSTKNVMLYGHLDKQPWLLPWGEGLGPCDPVIRGDYLYGRGGADDGYSAFSCMLAIKNLQLQGVAHPRCVLVLETEEESGSPNLLYLLDLAKDVIGTPDAMFCMDSGCFDYEQLWITSSLRGITIVDLTVEAGKQGYHSGELGGIIPETFRIVRQLLDRIDNSETGLICKEMQVEVPAKKMEEAKFMADKCGDSMYTKYKIHDGVKAMEQENIVEMYLNNVWRANLAITGAAGLPEIQIAGNVVRQSTSVRLSCRLPPTMSPVDATKIITEKLTTDVPYNAKVTLGGGHGGYGWCAKDYEAWLDEGIKQAGADFFEGKPTGSYGMGGSIPFLAELEKMYPATQIVAMGLLGPFANAHAPDECINLAYAKKLTCSLSHIIACAG